MGLGAQDTRVSCRVQHFNADGFELPVRRIRPQRSQRIAHFFFSP